MASTIFSAMMSSNQRFFARHQHAAEAAHRRAVESGVSQPVVVLIDLGDQAGRHVAQCLGVTSKVIRRRLNSARRDRKAAQLILVLPLRDVEPVMRSEAPGAAQWLFPLGSASCHWVLVAGSGGVSVASLFSPKEAQEAAGLKSPDSPVCHPS